LETQSWILAIHKFLLQLLGTNSICERFGAARF
jgi:hypothetical protein